MKLLQISHTTIKMLKVWLERAWPMLRKMIASDIFFPSTENNFQAFDCKVWFQGNNTLWPMGKKAPSCDPLKDLEITIICYVDNTSCMRKYLLDIRKWCNQEKNWACQMKQVNLMSSSILAEHSSKTKDMLRYHKKNTNRRLPFSLELGDHDYPKVRRPYLCNIFDNQKIYDPLPGARMLQKHVMSCACSIKRFFFFYLLLLFLVNVT